MNDACIYINRIRLGDISNSRAEVVLLFLFLISWIKRTCDWNSLLIIVKNLWALNEKVMYCVCRILFEWKIALDNCLDLIQKPDIPRYTFNCAALFPPPRNIFDFHSQARVCQLSLPVFATESAVDFRISCKSHLNRLVE